MTDRLDDIQAFPVLTSEINHVDLQRPATPGSASLGALAQNALREVLAIRPSESDPKSFVAALHNAFSVSEVEGRTIWTWTPRSFTVQADMGEVTGAQASIHARAKAALDQSVLLLDALAALRSDADDEDIEATRAIVRSGLLELVDELGRVGGPRVQRVDSLFDQLLGVAQQQTSLALPPTNGGSAIVIETDPEKVGGLLGSIRERFGLSRAQVNTIDEEQNLTNYLILVDHIIALRQNWEARKTFFTGQAGDVFLGTQLVQLGWALGVLAESVYEAEKIMDSVFLGPAERQTLKLRFNDPRYPFADPSQPPLTIAELLSWIERFAREEGPQIIREAGKEGVISLIATLQRLDKLIGLTQQIANLPSDNPTRGFHTPRVQRSIDELAVHVRRATELASQVRRLPAPVIRFVEPISSAKGQGVTLQIFGENFQPGAQVILELPALPDRAAQQLTDGQPHFVSAGLLRAVFDLRSAESGAWTVVVRNPDLGEGRKPAAFVVELDVLPPPTPELVEIVPDAGVQGQQVQVIAAGVDLRPDHTWDFGLGISVSQLVLLPDQRVQLLLTISETATTGARDVSVTNSDGLGTTLSGGFTVLPAPPATTPPPTPEIISITALQPERGAQGTAGDIEIEGTGFEDQLYSVSFGEGVVVNSTTFVDATHLLVNILISATATPSLRDVLVISEGNAIARFPRGFVVDAQQEIPPTIFSVAPDLGGPGQIQIVRVTGAGFQSGAAASFGEGTAAVSGFVSSQQLVVELTISSDAVPGPRDVVVTNPDGTSATLPDRFTVISSGPAPSIPPTNVPIPTFSPTGSPTPTFEPTGSPLPSGSPTPTFEPTGSPLPSGSPAPTSTAPPSTTFPVVGTISPPPILATVPPIGGPPVVINQPPFELGRNAGAPLQIRTIEFRSGDQVVGRQRALDGGLSSAEPLVFNASQAIDNIRVVFNKRVDLDSATRGGIVVRDVEHDQVEQGLIESHSPQVVNFAHDRPFESGRYQVVIGGDRRAGQPAMVADDGAQLGGQVELAFVISQD